MLTLLAELVDGTDEFLRQCIFLVDLGFPAYYSEGVSAGVCHFSPPVYLANVKRIAWATQAFMRKA